LSHSAARTLSFGDQEAVLQRKTLSGGSAQNRLLSNDAVLLEDSMIFQEFIPGDVRLMMLG